MWLEKPAANGRELKAFQSESKRSLEPNKQLEEAPE
jgi:hypothetical protein